MKLFLTLFYTFSLSLLSSAQENDKKEALLQTLFDSRDKIEFARATIEAKKLDISDQVILEATFLYHIDKNEYTEIAELTAQFQKMAATFDPNKSKIFSHQEDWLSVIEYGLALKALEKHDLPLFKKHIKEAFWLSPNKANAFAHHIDKIHTNEAMKNVRLNLKRGIYQVDKDEATSLEKMLENKDALVLRFWSPWNQQANESLPFITHLAEQCSAHNIAFASLLINKDPQGIKDNKELIAETKKPLPSLWLADENNGHLTKQLRVAALPTIVIVSKQGKILFNGSVVDKELWTTLKKIAPKIHSASDN